MFKAMNNNMTLWKNELVGTYEIHDATIISVIRNGRSLIVNLKTDDGKNKMITFSNVQEVTSYKPEGMILYSLESRKIAWQL